MLRCLTQQSYLRSSVKELGPGNKLECFFKAPTQTRRNVANVEASVEITISEFLELVAQPLKLFQMDIININIKNLLNCFLLEFFSF